MKRPRLVYGLVVFLLALLPRLAYVEQNESLLGLDVSRLDQTDNHVFAEWARIIAAGDLLCREQPHAYHHWTAEVAPEDRWLEWYGGDTIYHQAPLYPYMVAAVFHLLGDEHAMVARAQALLGALTCLLTFLLAWKVLSPRGALLAGLMLAFMGSYYFYDAFILRDGPMAFLVVLLAYALQAAVEKDSVRRWLTAGMTLGLFSLAKETGPALMALTLVGLAIWKRSDPKAAALRGGVVILGWLLLLSPAIARNLEVGAPPLKLSTRGPEVFITGNALGQDGVGWDPPIDEMRRILMDANFKLGKSMAATLATHRADPWGYVEVLWNKTRAFFNGYEVPNNVDFYLHRAHLPTLRLGFVSMSFLAPACLLGLLLAIPRRRKLAVPLLLLGAVSASVIALYMLARFRLQALPLMAVFAALSVDWAWTTVSERRWARLVAGGLVFSALATWTWWDADPFGERNKHTGVMMKLAKIGDFEKAMRYRDFLVESLAGDATGVDADMAAKLAMLTDGFALFEQGSQLAEQDPRRHLLLGEGYSMLQEVTKRGDLRDMHALALRHFGRALDLDPDVVGADYGMGVALSRLAHHQADLGEGLDLAPALSAFGAEIRKHPDHGPSRRDAGHIYMAWGDEPRALEQFLEAERLGFAGGPELAEVAHISVDTRLSAEPARQVAGEIIPVTDPARGLVYGERALALAPDTPLVLDRVATVLYVHRRFDESVALLEKLIALQPWREQDLRHRVTKFMEVKRNLAERDRLSQEQAAPTDGDPAPEPEPIPPIEGGEEG
jgi:4-amino-4-deoxy-L-arabinose transferase-like glycosyltransferase/tetratricopeptide (TPR) repeat protein